MTRKTAGEGGDYGEQVRRLAELINGIEFAMMTTIDEKGRLHSRPMATQRSPFDGDVWFFTKASSLKANELGRNRAVNLSYVSADASRFVSVSGSADVVRDRGKAAELWPPAYRGWFPDGLDDPDLVLIRVRVEYAEYWDGPSSMVVHALEFVKTIATGTEYDSVRH